MNEFIELYKEKESVATTTIPTKEEIKKDFFDLEKYPTGEMKAKKTRYKLVLD